MPPVKQRCQFGNHNRGVVSEHTIIFTKNKGLSCAEAGDLGLAEQDADVRKQQCVQVSLASHPFTAPENTALSLLRALLGNKLSGSISGSFPGKQPASDFMI